MQQKLLSLILLSYYSKDRIINVYENVRTILAKENIPFEFIIMDDGSKDNSFEIASELAAKKANVIARQLSRNFSSNYSIFAGLSIANGACAMAIPDDEQQPYETIVQMYRLWEKGEKIIIPHRIMRRDSVFNTFFSNSYYKIMNSLSDVEFPLGGADLFFIDREVVDIINARIHPIKTSVMVEILRLGFNPYFLSYKRPLGLNEGKSRWTFKKKVELAKDTFISSSTFPIKLITNTGLFFSVVSFLLIIFYTINYFFYGNPVPGWTTTVVMLSFFSGLILFSLGVLAEYIWRIYEEVKNRPGYIIKKKTND